LDALDRPPGAIDEYDQLIDRDRPGAST
jgi:hypothetical protein